MGGPFRPWLGMLHTQFTRDDDDGGERSPSSNSVDVMDDAECGRSKGYPRLAFYLLPWSESKGVGAYSIKLHISSSRDLSLPLSVSFF